MTTSIEVCNAALLMVGANTISSFEDGSTESRVCAGLYEPTVLTQLTRHPWRFARQQAVLSRLVSAPIHKYDAAYTIPADCLAPRGVFVGDDPIEFDVVGDQIHCSVSADSTVILEYTIRAHEAKWIPAFTSFIQAKLGASFALGVAERGDLAGELRIVAEGAANNPRDEGLFGIAKRANDQSTTAQRLPTGRLARRG